jgi:hypothetical protein
MSNIINIIRPHITGVLRIAPRGIPAARLESVEKRRSVLIPHCLKQYYLFNGEDKRLNRASDRLLKPEQIYVEKDYLVFCEENQAVARWGLRLTSTSDDPPVYQEWLSTKGLVWTVDQKRFSTFMIAFAYWQSVNGFLPYSAYGTGLRSKCLRAVRDAGKVVHRNPQFMVITIYDVIGVFFKERDEPGMAAVYLGARSHRSLVRVEKKMGIKWSYSD